MSGEIIPVNHELWMRDSDTKTCIGCEASFTTFRRRHHCRYCGLIFCNKCATKRKEMLAGRKLKVLQFPNKTPEPTPHKPRRSVRQRCVYPKLRP